MKYKLYAFSFIFLCLFLLATALVYSQMIEGAIKWDRCTQLGDHWQDVSTPNMRQVHIYNCFNPQTDQYMMI